MILRIPMKPVTDSDFNLKSGRFGSESLDGISGIGNLAVKWRNPMDPWVHGLEFADKKFGDEHCSRGVIFSAKTKKVLQYYPLITESILWLTGTKRFSTESQNKEEDCHVYLFGDRRYCFLLPGDFIWTKNEKNQLAMAVPGWHTFEGEGNHLSAISRSRVESLVIWIWRTDHFSAFKRQLHEHSVSVKEKAGEGRRAG